MTTRFPIKSSSDMVFPLVRLFGGFRRVRGELPAILLSADALRGNARVVFL